LAHGGPLLRRERVWCTSPGFCLPAQLAAFFVCGWRARVYRKNKKKCRLFLVLERSESPLTRVVSVRQRTPVLRGWTTPNRGTSAASAASCAPRVRAPTYFAVQALHKRGAQKRILLFAESKKFLVAGSRGAHPKASYRHGGTPGGVLCSSRARRVFVCGWRARHPRKRSGSCLFSAESTQR
jgi:hypothetical protein